MDDYIFDEEEATESGVLLNQGDSIAFIPDRRVDLTNEDSVKDFFRQNNGSSFIDNKNFSYNIKKLSDLSEEDQKQIRARIPDAEPSFEFIIVSLKVASSVGNTNPKPEILNQLRDEITSKYKIYTIETSTSRGNVRAGYDYFSLAIPKIEYTKSKVAIEANSDTIEAINNFGYLASILLIEPRVYLDNPDSIRQELERINSLFYNKYTIEPSFYGYALALVHNEEGEISRTVSNSKMLTTGAGLVTGAAGVGTALLASNPVGWAVAGGGFAISLFGVGPFGTGLLGASSDSVKLNLQRIGIAEAVPHSNNQNLFKEIISYNSPKNIDYLTFAKNIGISDEIPNAIESFVEDIYMKSKTFEIFQRLANDIKVGSVTASILRNTTLRMLSEEREEDKNKISIFSTELAGQELDQFLKHIFMFPERDDYIGNEQDAYDIFEIKGDFLYLEDDDPDSHYYYGVKDGTKLSKDGQYLFSQQYNDSRQNRKTTIQDSYFSKRKEALKDYNNRMLGFLKTLLDSLIDDASILNFDTIYKIDPVLGRSLGEQDIFKLLESNTYPDILLPRDPLLGRFKEEAASRLSPDFYFFKHNPGSISEEERSKARKILNKSKEFKDHLKNNGVTSKEDKEVIAFYDSNVFMNISPENGSTNVQLTVEKHSEDNTNLVRPQTNIDIQSIANISDGTEEDYLNNLSIHYSNQIEIKAEEIKKIGGAFGNKFSLVNNQANPPDSLEAISEDSFIHFDNDSGIIKAFPTFRLYLIEEDSIYSDRLLAFDDFFYYNSVISFNVYNSRELAASTATIQLQNVSGLLDGTRKSVLRDIDINSLAVTAENEDQVPTVESVVLRKGINVQLRAGYANNTNDLDVLISGTVTELSYSGDNMICSIVVQSYGVELESVKVSPGGSNQSNNAYYSTHQLLGSLLLSSQLKHFGRVKTGKIFQIFESKIPSLDMTNYTSSSGWSFNYTNSWLDWASDNAMLLGAGALVLSFFTPSIKSIGAALKNIPYLGKGITVLSKKLVPQSLISKYVVFSSKAVSYVSNLGVTKTNAATLEVIKRLGGQADDVLTRFIPTGSQTGANETARLLIVNRLESAGIQIASASPLQIKQALNTIIQEEFGLLARVFGWGASPALAAQRLGTLPLARAASTSYGSKIISFGKGLVDYGIIVPSRLNAGLAVGILSVTAPLVISEFVFEGLVKIWEKFWSESKRPSITKLLLSPQDDNIYCPDPATYLNLEGLDSRTGIISPILRASRATQDIFIQNSLLSVAVPGFLNMEGNDLTSIAADIKRKAKGIIDPRLQASRKENEYVVTGKTIWQVLHDMSLRHPGYIYGARPYGNSLEYRVFFGQPGQRYFRKEISNFAVFRLNNIYEKISKLKDRELLSIEDINLLFPQESQAWGSQMASNTSASNDLNNLKQAYFTDYAKSEWLKKTKDRFVPFRQYHAATSGRNLVANNVIVSGHNVFNAVSTHYNITDDGGSFSVSRGTGVWRAVSNSNTPQELIRENVVKDDNIKGIAAAWRYSCSSLIYGAKNMYEGSILLLGNSKINPWDIIILNDNVNTMYGPLEVKAITHMFSHETGYLTDIEVNAVVTHIGDETTYPVMHQSVFFEARKELFERFKSKAAFENRENQDEFIEKIISEKVDDFIDEQQSQLDYIGIDRLSKARRNEKQSKEIQEAKDKLKEEFIKYYTKRSKAAPFFLNDIVQEGAVLPRELEAPIQELGTALGLTGGALAGTSFLAESFYRSVVGLETKIFRLPGLVGAVAGGLGLYASTVGAPSLRNYLSESLNSGWLGKNIFRPTILSKVDNNGIIEVYPLVKDGRPLLAGGFENAREDEKWQNILGNIYSSISAGYKGYLEHKQTLDSYGKTAAYMEDVPTWIQVEDVAMEGSITGTVKNYKYGENQ